MTVQNKLKTYSTWIPNMPANWLALPLSCFAYRFNKKICIAKKNIDLYRSRFLPLTLDNKEMSPYTERSRRNLIIMSALILVIWFLEVPLKDISILGIDLNYLKSDIWKVYLILVMPIIYELFNFRSNLLVDGIFANLTNVQNWVSYVRLLNSTRSVAPPVQTLKIELNNELILKRYDTLRDKNLLTHYEKIFKRNYWRLYTNITVFKVGIPFLLAYLAIGVCLNEILCINLEEDAPLIVVKEATTITNP